MSDEAQQVLINGQRVKGNKLERTSIDRYKDNEFKCEDRDCIIRPLDLMVD